VLEQSTTTHASLPGACDADQPARIRRSCDLLKLALSGPSVESGGRAQDMWEVALGRRSNEAAAVP
jgi:hypothetical protein